MQGKEADFKGIAAEDTDGELEAKVVRPVEATLLGLQKDTVYWQRGLLASPTVTFNITPRPRVESYSHGFV